MPDHEREPNIERLRANDPTEWTLAYRQLWKLGMKVAHEMLIGPQHVDDRNDLVSRAIGKLVKYFLGSSGNSNHFSKWRDFKGSMITQTTNSIIDFYKRRSTVQKNLGERTDSAALENHADPNGFTESFLELNEVDPDELWRLVDDLPPPQPDIIRLYSAGELTQEEIVVELNLGSRGQFQHQLRKALAALRGLL